MVPARGASCIQRTGAEDARLLVRRVDAPLLHLHRGVRSDHGGTPLTPRLTETPKFFAGGAFFLGIILSALAVGDRRSIKRCDGRLG